jgi:arylsulfatase A-like enzyme
MTKKNLIMIMIDGGRLDYALKSKIFSKIKSNSVFLSQSITYGPHTIAAMHAVFSGSYGTRTGTNSYWSTFKFKKNQFKTLTEYLHENDYYTQADVINQLVIPKQGFDEFVVHDENNDDLTSRHKEILHNLSTSSNKKNFFVYLHYSNIHTGIKNEVLDVYRNHSKEFFENVDKNKKRYSRLFQKAENYIESILDEIKKLQLDKNSFIIIMSDHGVSTGEKFGEHAYGAFCYDYTLRTFTYFLANDLSQLEIKQQTRTIDFMPTILDYLKIPIEQNCNKLDGISLLPLINGESIPENYAFTETGHPLYEKSPPKEPNVKSIRTSKWKLIFNEYDNSKELYNLEADPYEKTNIIDTGESMEEILWKELQIIMNTHD